MINKVINCLKRARGNMRFMLASKKYGFLSSRSPSIVGIMYHGITCEGVKGLLDRRLHYRVPFEQFQSEMRYFCRRYDIVGIYDLGKNVKSHRNRLIVTFDDGYRNVYTNAYPHLKEKKIPALLFIATGFVQEQKAFWDDRLFYAFKNTQKEEFIFAFGSYVYKFSILSEKQKLRAFKTLIRLFSDELTGPKRDEGVEYVLNELEVAAEDDNVLNNENNRPLGVEDIERMAQEGVVNFGSHTVNHYGLGNCDEEVIYNELLMSKKAIEEWTGKPCLALSLPGGSWKEEVSEIAKGLGYKYIFNSVPDINKLPPDFYSFKRYCVRGNTMLSKHMLF